MSRRGKQPWFVAAVQEGRRHALERGQMELHIPHLLLGVLATVEGMSLLESVGADRARVAEALRGLMPVAVRRHGQRLEGIRLSEDARAMYGVAEAYARRRGAHDVTPIDLFHAAAATDTGVRRALSKIGMDQDTLDGAAERASTSGAEAGHFEANLKEYAQVEAQNHGHTEVLALHLLLGLFATREGVVLLSAMAVDRSVVRDALHALLPPDLPPVQDGKPHLRRTMDSSATGLLKHARRQALLHNRSAISAKDAVTAALASDPAVRHALAMVGITYQALDQAEATIASPATRERPVWYLRIDAASDVPLYEQIIARVQEAIAKGDLVDGEKLPPVRQLADELSIAPGTVARAYSALEERRLVVTDGARGTRVAPPHVRDSGGAGIADLMEMMLPVVIRGYHSGASAADLRSALERVMAPVFSKA